MDWTPFIAAGGLILGIINSVVVVLTYRATHAARVEGVVNSSIPTTDWQPRASITATNIGHLPVTITSVAFELTNGNTLALMDSPPGHDLRPVLGPGESRQRWALRSGLIEAIHEHAEGPACSAASPTARAARSGGPSGLTGAGVNWATGPSRSRGPRRPGPVRPPALSLSRRRSDVAVRCHCT